MSTRTFANTLTKTVDELTRPESYKDLYHEHKDGVPLPSGEVLQKIVDLARGIIFPGYYGRSCIDTNTLKYHLGVDTEQLYSLLVTQIQAGLSYSNTNENIIPSAEFVSPCLSHSEMEVRHQAELYAELFISKLPELRRVLATDVVAAFNGDPAAKNYGEIISCYPVIKELTVYRIAHELWNMNVPLIPRMLTEMGHSETGIDIHPGAQIGEYFTIDHGTGVVIGETCIIGKNVKLYQGVTLGAKSFPLDDKGNPIKGIPRHPILEDDVIVYSNASILGRITIGKGAIIGGNVWVTQDVKAGENITQKR
ncbi:MAG: serine acetyltransferase [Bacteroidaceae bacterium]|jgi:serine O-acetyltransferase|nr:serine acetyltransferase [Bacteroidaceae bacterium]